MGPGPQLVGRQEGINNTPLTMEKLASREYALDAAKGVGGLLGGSKG